MCLSDESFNHELASRGLIFEVLLKDGPFLLILLGREAVVGALLVSVGNRREHFPACFPRYVLACRAREG